MPIEITTPFPTLDETAKQLGVSKQHARHIERLVLGDQVKIGTQKAAGRSGGTRRGSGLTAKRYTKKPK
jgi:predicted ArsR family transcriptional regulator